MKRLRRYMPPLARAAAVGLGATAGIILLSFAAQAGPIKSGPPGVVDQGYALAQYGPPPGPPPYGPPRPPPPRWGPWYAPAPPPPPAPVWRPPPPFLPPPAG